MSQLKNFTAVFIVNVHTARYFASFPSLTWISHSVNGQWGSDCVPSGDDTKWLQLLANRRWEVPSHMMTRLVPFHNEEDAIYMQEQVLSQRFRLLAPLGSFGSSKGTLWQKRVFRIAPKLEQSFEELWFCVLLSYAWPLLWVPVAPTWKVSSLVCSVKSQRLVHFCACWLPPQQRHKQLIFSFELLPLQLVSSNNTPTFSCLVNWQWNWQVVAYTRFIFWSRAAAHVWHEFLCVAMSFHLKRWNFQVLQMCEIACLLKGNLCVPVWKSHSSSGLLVCQKVHCGRKSGWSFAWLLGFQTTDFSLWWVALQAIMKSSCWAACKVWQFKCTFCWNSTKKQFFESSILGSHTGHHEKNGRIEVCSAMLRPFLSRWRHSRKWNVLWSNVPPISLFLCLVTTPGLHCLEQ